MITLRLDKKVIDRIDILAKKAGISRHQLILNMITVGTEELELYADLGFFKLNIALRELHRKFKNLPEDTRQKALDFAN